MNSKTRDTPNPLHQAQTTVLRDKELSMMRALVSKYPMEALGIISSYDMVRELDSRGTFDKEEDVDCGKKSTDL